MTIIYFILILGIIIFVHELGHFVFAKLFDVYVYDFSLGMGPAIFKKKGKETEYCLRAIPIGGSCSLAGEEVEDSDDIPKNRKLYSKPVWQRFLIMFFGAGNNFILAIILLFTVGLIWGSPVMDPVFRGVEEGYPMYDAGVRPGDTVLEVNGHNITTIDDVKVYMTLASEGSEVSFKLKDNSGKIKSVKVTPIKEKIDGEEKFRFGVVFDDKLEKGFVSSVKYAFVKTGALIKQMGIVLKSLFTGGLSVKSMSGPVGIYSIVDDTKSMGFNAVLHLTALLCVNVGFLNLIPFPAFDGGRILFLAIEKIKGSPVKQKTENTIHAIGFIMLMLLLLYVTFNDILKLF